MNPDFDCMDFLWMALGSYFSCSISGAIEVWKGGGRTRNAQAALLYSWELGWELSGEMLITNITISSAEIEQKSVSSVFLLSSDNVNPIYRGARRNASTIVE